MASGEPGQHDYTEGASPMDIRDAIASSSRARRDSQYSMATDNEGAMFDGPGSTTIPTSVSRMSYTDRRRSSEFSRTRRRSEDGQQKRRTSTDNRSQVSGGSPEGSQNDREEREDDLEGVSLRRGRRSKRSLSPTLNKSSVFENIAHMFGRAAGEPPEPRRSLSAARSSISSTRRSRRSRLSDAGSDLTFETEEDGNERWGYSSGEEDDSVDSLSSHALSGISSEVEYGSSPPSPGPSTHLPLLSTDPIFGDEVRIDIDAPLEPSEPPPPGPPSRQKIFVADEDTTLLFVGYEIVVWRQCVWRVCCVVTLGIFGLLGHWFPRLWLRWVVREQSFENLKHGFVAVEGSHRDITLIPVKHLAYPYERSTIFPRFASELEGPTGCPPKPRLNGNDNDKSDIIGDLLFVDYRYSRFVLDPCVGLFTMLRDWRDPSWTDVQSVQHGLPQHVRKQRLTLFGANLIDIEGKSTLSLLVDEVIHPFYVFQIASIVLWSLDDYYYYAFCIALISTSSIASTLIDTKQTIKRMRAMSRFSCDVVVYTDGRWSEKSSVELVPGDIVNLSDMRASYFPADILLLSGDAIVNESMLTGESVPVAKIPVKDEDIARWREMKDVGNPLAKSFLYAGTRIVRLRGALGIDGTDGMPALGLVVRSGFNTTKGALIRSMLFPKPIGFKFYSDSIRFIGVLAGVAGLGFCASAVQFIRLNIPWTTIIIRALDLITIVVPPALPATLSIGTSFSIGRLRKLGIYCISPTRVNVSGKINVCCFDKTGTLTEDGLDILGVRSLDRTEHRFGQLIDNVYDLPNVHDRANFLHALATCHSLRLVDGEAIGDPLDVKMFGFTRWTLEEGLVAGTGVVRGKSGTERPTPLVQTVVRPPGSARFRLEDALRANGKHAHFLELGVIRTFEFVSALRRMSVFVKRLRSSSMEIYVKGAPEVIAEICERDSFPQDYDDLLSYYTRRGYRVIAIAGKSIEGLTWLKAQKMKREQAESNLRFLGLVIFENKLKPGTTPAIQSLRGAHLACRMITGDNALTAVSVARECTLISPAAHVFSPAFMRGDANTPLSKLEWSCMEDLSWKLDSYNLKPLTPPPHHTVEHGEFDYQDYALVVTGDAFRWMVSYAPLETLQRMLVKTQVFARMSPDEKNEVVERLQALGYTVLMCGDGANDCAALKAADVGISLSEAEASVAAPFTSSVPDISCVIEVIKEGRAALATSFSCFKYMALYSLIQFTTITLLYSFASSLGDFQFLYIDLFIIIPIAVSMGRTLPYPRIYPKRPTASLISKKVLISLVGQILITSAVQFWTFFWVRRQEWYKPPHVGNASGGGTHLSATNYENTVLFLVSCFQYILAAAVFSIGPPYRRPMWTNSWLMAFVVGLSLLSTLLVFRPPKFLALVLELMHLPWDARLWLAVFVVINVALSVAFEKWVGQAMLELIRVLLSCYHERKRYRGGKAYKAVEGGMR
ncbi:hypothetical protein BKA83DRAFT_4241204 [Pisolithus microcarpus]|nr:hypothetical protein BKA83DRAFT_4241204 [Pisolithus microcarpus]